MDQDTRAAVAALPPAERQRIVDGFVDRVFAGVEDEDALVLASFMRELPSTPPADLTAGQIDAWVELAELVGDGDFEQTLRRTARYAASDHRIEFGLNVAPLVRAHAGAAVDSGVAPESDDGRAILNRMVPVDLSAAETDSLLDWLDTVTEPRVARFWLLSALVNGQPPGQPALPAFQWLHAAVRAHRGR
jgi:hypothetical protein